MHHNVRQKTADAQQYRRRPLINQMARVSRQSQAKRGEYGKHAGFGCDCQVSECDSAETALSHQRQANGADLESFMTTEHEPIFLLSVEQARDRIVSHCPS